MNQRLPFYMVYGTEKFMEDDDRWGNMNWWNEEHMSRRDYEYMKSTYPEMAKRIMPYIERECDRLEYSGSMMFDEYPDQLQLRMMCRRILSRLKEDMVLHDKIGRSDQFLLDMIWVIAWQEILNRRSEYRRYRRKIY